VASAAKIEEAGNIGYQTNHMSLIFKQGMSFSGYERDGLFLNLGGGSFRDISGVSGIDSITDGRGTIMADFDNDGDLDVVVTTIQRTSRLLQRNNVGQDNKFLRLTLEGTRSGRDAFGAVARLETALGVQTKIKSGGGSFVSGNDSRLLFGLGSEADIAWLEVTWPAGSKQRFTGIRANESLRIVEGAAVPERLVEKRFHLVDPEAQDTRVYRSLAIGRGEQLPAFRVIDLNGVLSDLGSSLKPGRRTLVNFWATWCLPCRQEMRELQALRPRLESSGVDLIGVSLDFEEAAAVGGFLKDNRVTYPIVIAEKESLERLLKGDDLGLPFSLLLDESGALVSAFSGWSEESRKTLEKLTALKLQER